MLELNSILVKSPSEFQVDFNDIDSEDSYRNAKGESNRDRIASDKRKLNCGWSALTQQEVSTILKAIKPVYFPIKYWDPEDGLITKTFYAGPKTMPMLFIREGQPMWEGLKVNFIEK